jgi:hypothetical protein
MFDADGLSERAPHRGVKNRDDRTFGSPLNRWQRIGRSVTKQLGITRKKRRDKDILVCFQLFTIRLFWAYACFPRSDAGEGF